MRTVRGMVLLLGIVSSVMCFADERVNHPALPKTDSVLSQNPDGTFQFHILPSRGAQRQFSVGNFTSLGQVKGEMASGIGCYYIHSYKRTRVDNTDETMAAGETNCTPSSRFRFKSISPPTE